MNTEILSTLECELQKHTDPIYKQQAARFFKEKITLIGVRIPLVRKISVLYFRQIKKMQKEDLFQLIEELLQKKNQEYTVIAFDWLYRIKKFFTKEDIYFFERYLEKYITNWAVCDDLCTHALGYFIYKYPEYISELKKWTQSLNRWMRRAAAITLIYGLNKKLYLEDALLIADQLLQDSDDLVQKGYGWMLKKASESFPQDIYNYVEKHKHTMPRTALRYAIEKLSSDQRKILLTK